MPLRVGVGLVPTLSGEWLNAYEKEQGMTKKKKCILIADDEESIRDACCKVLDKEGYRLETAVDGVEGLQKIREVRPDLVLVDLKMPGMSGMDLLAKIKEIDQTIIPVVITGYGTVESAVEAMKRSAFDFLPKPFTPEQLRTVVRKGLIRRKTGLESKRVLDEKERVRENFAAIVSHQLRSPLASVRQSLEVISQGFAGHITDEQKEMLGRVNARIEELMNMINDWLQSARLKKDTTPERFGPVDISKIFSEVVEVLKPLAERQQIILETEVSDNFPVIRGNGEALKQVFMNLVDNGLSYNVKGGKVSIRATEKEDDVAINVSDTGIGISEKHLPLIFDELFRVKSKETQGIEGSGLGLSIAKRIVELHGGSISVTSKPGKGSTFSLRLPKNEVEPGEPSVSPDQRAKPSIDLNQVVSSLGLEFLIAQSQPAIVTGGYASDLLSDVLAHAHPGDVLVTVQNHTGVIALAKRLSLAAVIFASGRIPEDWIIEMAKEQQIPLYVSHSSAFETVGKLYNLLAASSR